MTGQGQLPRAELAPQGQFSPGQLALFFLFQYLSLRLLENVKLSSEGEDDLRQEMTQITPSKTP
jgi:hypothetical protein